MGLLYKTFYFYDMNSGKMTILNPYARKSLNEYKREASVILYRLSHSRILPRHVRRSNSVAVVKYSPHAWHSPETLASWYVIWIYYSSFKSFWMILMCFFTMSFITMFINIFTQFQSFLTFTYYRTFKLGKFACLKRLIMYFKK